MCLLFVSAGLVYHCVSEVFLKASAQPVSLKITRNYIFRKKQNSIPLFKFFFFFLPQRHHQHTLDQPQYFTLNTSVHITQSVGLFICKIMIHHFDFILLSFRKISCSNDRYILCCLLPEIQGIFFILLCKPSQALSFISAYVAIFTYLFIYLFACICLYNVLAVWLLVVCGQGATELL